MPTLETLCNTAYHDGSARYVPPATPVLGGTIPVYVETGPALRARRLWARTVPDGDPTYTEAIREPRAGEPRDRERAWWRIELPLANPDTHYRFLLDTDHGRRWLTAAGVSDVDVPDTCDFAVRCGAGAHVPAWADHAVVYQVFIDRFRASGRMPQPLPDWAVPAAWDDAVAAGTPDGVRQVFGGDLWGAIDGLGHIASLGANTIYLTPFFPARSNHRYDSTTFDYVDPLLGGDEALIAFVRAAHERGLRVIGDITLNHCGDDHEWFRAAMADPGAPEREFFYIEPDGSYATFCGVPSLPKFDHRSAELRRRLYDGPDSVVATYLRAPFDLDGWRVDVAQSAGRYREVDLSAEVARATRRTVQATKADAILLAEHGFDASRELRGDGWMGTMAYSGFSRPVWQWLAEHRDGPDFWGVPGPIAPYDGGQLARVMNEFAAITPHSGVRHSLNLLDSHDTARFRWIAGAAGQRLGIALQCLLPGIPMIFAGDEAGVQGRGMEDGRRPYPWGAPPDPVEALYRELLAVRAEHPALVDGSMRWLHAEANRVVFLREGPTERLLVQVARGASSEPVDLPEPARLLWADGEGPGDLGAGDRLPCDGPGVGLWALPGRESAAAPVAASPEGTAPDSL